MQNKNKPCLLFFDIDGTILSETTGQISDNTKNAIRRARENGHLVFINSGRTICNIDSEIKAIGFDGYVCGCGTYIQYNGERLLSYSIDGAPVLELLEDIRTCGLDAVLEGSDGIYFGQDLKVPQWAGMKERLSGLPDSPVRDWDCSGISFDKFCVWSGSDGNYKKFYNKYKNRFEFIDRGNTIWEAVPLGYSKATGIRFLMEHLDIPYENTFALGDSSNDLSMLEFAKNSIAMGNCTPFLRQLVSFVTRDVDDNGIEHALQHYGLI